MDFKGDRLTYNSSDGSTHGRNHATDQMGHHRQPSYLAAVGLTRPSRSAEPIQDLESLHSVALNNTDSHNQMISCHGRFQNSDAENHSVRMLENFGSYKNVQDNPGGTRGVEEFNRISHTFHPSNANFTNEMPRNYLSSIDSGQMRHKPLYNYAPSPNVKNIPRAVVAPMSSHNVVDYNSEKDRFRSVPQTVKFVNSDLERDRNNAKCSSNYSEGSKSSAIITGTGYSDVYSNMDRSGPTETQHRYTGRWRTSCNDADDDRSYIHPHKVEQVLSLQRSRKPSSMKGESTDVTKQKLVPPTASIKPHYYSANFLEVSGQNCEFADGLSDVPFNVRCRIACDVDQISASSVSTGSSASDSHHDSGYGSSRHSESLTGSVSQSPELQSFDNRSISEYQRLPSCSLKERVNHGCSPKNDRTNTRPGSGHIDANKAARYSGTVESVQQSQDWTQTISRVPSSSVDRIQKVNTQPEISDHFKRMVDDKMKPTLGSDYKKEELKYLQMLNKQIRLNREKDEKNVTHYHHPVAKGDFLPGTPTGRNMHSSCVDLGVKYENADVKSDVAKRHGSADFGKCVSDSGDAVDGIGNLISKKKSVKLNQIGRGTRHNIHSDPGTSEWKNSSVKNAIQVSKPSFADKTERELNKEDADRMLSGSHEDGSSIQSGRRDTLGYPCSFVARNSAEDIVSTWTMMKDKKVDESLNTQNISVPDSGFCPDFPVLGKHCKKTVSFSDSIALIASTEEVPQENIDYVEYVTSFLCKRTNGLQSYEATDDQNSCAESSSHGSLSSESRSSSSGSRSNSNVSLPESSSSSNTQDRDSDFYENELSSECSENDSEGTTVDENGKVRCSLCRKRWIDVSEVYCRDCYFYMSKFQ